MKAFFCWECLRISYVCFVREKLKIENLLEWKFCTSGYSRIFMRIFPFLLDYEVFYGVILLGWVSRFFFLTRVEIFF
jgi:hypothetical protein